MNWQIDWDDAVGLWQKTGPGHVIPTKDMKIVHSAPEAAGKLLVAARLNELHEIDPEKILRTLRDMQWKNDDDGYYGCIKWYFEEEFITDPNAAFFIGLKLIILRICYYERLTPVSQELLDEILAGLNIWFRNSLKHVTAYYLNKYLGDIVCKWLLQEIIGPCEEDDFVPDYMRRAADYWLEHHYGWGEHMSDGYCNVSLYELSILLLLAKKLPDDLRQTYQKLFNELLEIEDSFDNAPRVPVLRSYAFAGPVQHKNFRDYLSPDNGIMPNGGMQDLAQFLYEHNWHKAMPPRKQPRQGEFQIPCYGGNAATAFIEKDIRLGSMSHFPIMPSKEYPGNGLSWQSFPVAFIRNTTDWGFLQWETFEGGKFRAHPGSPGPVVNIPRAITETVQPCFSGDTYSFQHGSDLLVLRAMRCIPRSWESLTDRLRILAMTSADVEESSQGDWHQLLIHYPGRDVSVNFVPLTAAGKPELKRKDNNDLDWDYTQTEASPLFHAQRMMFHLWAFSLDGKIESAPEISIATWHNEARAQEEKIRTIDWKWKNIHWRIKIDPLSPGFWQELS